MVASASRSRESRAIQSGPRQGEIIPVSVYTHVSGVLRHASGALSTLLISFDAVATRASSIQVPGRTINLSGEPVEVVTTGRHDPCVGLRATPIAEAMLAIVLMDHYLRHRAQNADVVSATPDITRRSVDQR